MLVCSFFTFFLSTTDATVRRACSLQKTKQAEKPVAIFNPSDFSKARLRDGENVKLIFSEKEKKDEAVLGN